MFKLRSSFRIGFYRIAILKLLSDKATIFFPKATHFSICFDIYDKFSYTHETRSQQFQLIYCIFLWTGLLLQTV